MLTDGEPIAYADCRSDLLSPAILVPRNNCGGNLTIDEQLMKLDAVCICETLSLFVFFLMTIQYGYAGLYQDLEVASHF